MISHVKIARDLEEQPASGPTMEEINAFFADTSTAPPPNPAPSPNVTGNEPATAPQPTDVDLHAAAASDPTTLGEKFTSTFQLENGQMVNPG